MQFYSNKLQSGLGPLMNYLSDFHGMLMVLSMFMGVFVVALILMFYSNSLGDLSSGDYSSMEVAWTLIPAFVLMVIAVPSLKLLYFFDDAAFDVKKNILMKVTGHQWYWHYEYFCKGEYLDYDSFMINQKDLNLGDFRTLETDLSLMMHFNYKSRLLVSSADVLHSFALPCLGVKVDAVPGRLNQQMVRPFVPGVFYGQCSEICGANHSFMPICMKVVFRLN